MVGNDFFMTICAHLGVEGVFSEVTRLDEGVKVKAGVFEGEKGALLGSGR